MAVTITEYFAGLEEDFKPLEIQLINGMLNFERSGVTLEEASWQEPCEIMKKGGFKSQATNFWKYMYPLIKKGIAEPKPFDYIDDRKRPHKKTKYRITVNLSTFNRLIMNFKEYRFNFGSGYAPLLLETVGKEKCLDAMKAIALMGKLTVDEMERRHKQVVEQLKQDKQFYKKHGGKKAKD